MGALYVVRSNAVEGREAEFNEWYTNVHLPEVMALEGLLSAERFELDDEHSAGEQPHRYLAIYEIDAEDIPGTLENLKNAGFSLSDAIDLASLQVSVFRSLGDRLEE